MTNCLFYAIALFWRRYKKGKRQYIAIRKSDSGPFPHFLYVETRFGRDVFISYKPKQSITRTFPPPIFNGLVRWGDTK